MTARRAVLFLLLILCGAASLTCSPVYVLRAGIEEAKILSRRRPIPDVIADPATSPETRRKLELVMQARTFADEALHLDAGESFTTYSWVDSDTLLLVLSAAHKTRFEPHTWWFPIVGRVPYKGFFDFDDAHRAAAELAADGFDTYVRPSAAFSTLGWFNDPLLNTLLRAGDVDLAGTVIHELTHNSIYVPSQVAFNESFASFVGDRGAIAFFCGRDGDGSDTCRRARDSWDDTLLFGGFLSSLVAQLETLYATEGLATDQVLARREDVFAHGRTQFTETILPHLKTPNLRGFLQRPLNNATLIGIRLYYQRLDLFERVFFHHGSDLLASIRAIEAAAEAAPDDPFAAVEALLPPASP